VKILDGIANIRVYKVIDATDRSVGGGGGGDGDGGKARRQQQPSVRRYNERFVLKKTAPTTAAVNKYKNNNNVNDWRGLYTQFRRDHALGTVPYRWEDDSCTEAALVQVTIHSPIDVVVLEGSVWHEGAVSGSAKAQIAKGLLSIAAVQPLVDALGASGRALLVKETDDEPELVISHEFFARLDFSETRIAFFRRHPARPVTDRWRLETAASAGDNDRLASWKRWSDDECDRRQDAVLMTIPDLNSNLEDLNLVGTAGPSVVILFLDVDGVLLPFGSDGDDGNGDDTDTCQARKSTCGAIFPDCTLKALSKLLAALQEQQQGEEGGVGDNDDDGDAMLSSEQKKNDDRQRQRGRSNKIEIGIVLSSTWRVKESFRRDILDSFRLFGCSYGGPFASDSTANCFVDDFYDVTDPDLHGERQHEIYAWLLSQQEQQRGRHQHTTTSPSKISAWVAIDDEDLLEGEANARYRCHFENRVVRTDSRVGLTDQDADRAVRLIRDQLELLRSKSTASS